MAYLAVRAVFEIPDDFDDESWETMLSRFCEIFEDSGQQLQEECAVLQMATQQSTSYESCSAWLWDE